MRRIADKFGTYIRECWWMGC